MAKRSKKSSDGSARIKNARVGAAADARSLSAARKGIKTGEDFANFMSGLMSDLIEGRVPPGIGNATCNAGGKLLKIVEMQYKYGRPGTGGIGRRLSLTAAQ